jgi:hypothetical protein
VGYRKFNNFAVVVHTFIPIAEQEANDVFAATGTSTAAAL